MLPNKTDQSAIDSMVNDNNVVTDSKDIANLFNSYFANIGESLASAFDESDKCEVDSTKSTSRFRFGEITPEHKQLSRMPAGKTTALATSVPSC